MTYHRSFSGYITTEDSKSGYITAEDSKSGYITAEDSKSGYITAEDSKTHLVAVYSVTNPIWELVSGLKTLIVPSGNLEPLAAVDFAELTQAFREEKNSCLPDGLDQHLWHYLGENPKTKRINYRFHDLQPASAGEKPLIEYHIQERDNSKTTNWVGRQAFYRQPGTVIPVSFAHVRYTKGR
ncbi:hypothetical protein J4479_02565 [Candidatus Woesearchaeota archaeon]|nr:hypothetical protein [Candidatus Woesearchaeota archaeon]